MTQYLPPNLLALFAARDPIPYLPPVDKLTWEKKTDGYAGVANFTYLFEDPKDTPLPRRVETREERLERKRREKAEQMQYKLEQEIALWDPHGNTAATTDPYKSLFVARINYDSSESKLRREFEIYGSIKKIVMVHNKTTGKPRGYAFIEYEHERDMHSAYKHADGKKIDNRRVLVDVERSRTVKGWLPRRLGGGLGGTRRGGPDVNIKHSGREDDRKRGKDDDNYSHISRDRGDRERDREHSRRHVSRDKDRGDRDRGDRGDRDRGDRGDRDRRRRSKSREKKRRRSRSRDRERNGPEDEERRRHRSRSRERKRRSRSPRERKHRRDRDRERERARGDNEEALDSVKIKQEPEDDYPDYSGSYYNNLPMKDEVERPKNGVKYEEGEQGEANNEIDF